jgi:hypothetical protein
MRRRRRRRKRRREEEEEEGEDDIEYSRSPAYGVSLQLIPGYRGCIPCPLNAVTSVK